MATATEVICPTSLHEGEPIPYQWDVGRAPVLAWAPTGSISPDAYLLLLLGGSGSTARQVLGVPPEAPTAMATTLAKSIGYHELPRDLLVVAIGSDAYSDATDIGTAITDLPQAASRVMAIASCVGRAVFGAPRPADHLIVVGTSYGATVGWSLLARVPRFADTWVLLSGLPWNGTYMARSRSWEADVVARALRDNPDAEVLVASGASPEDVERTVCEGMMEVVQELGDMHPDVRGRLTPHVRLKGMHRESDFAIELGDVLERLPYHRSWDDR